MALSVSHADEQVVTLTPSDSRAFFDQQVASYLGISGDEFLRQWDAGELDAIADDPDRPEIMRLAMLIPLAR